ncbi:MAG: hypothetical protein ACYDAL_16285 [Candidatus Dormibacteraceae bacterium]
MTRDRIVTLLLIGFGILGLLYYLTKKPAAAAPGLGAPGSAGGAALERAATSAAGGVSGSIPSLIAAAAALTGNNYGAPASALLRNAGGAPQLGAIQPSIYDPGTVLTEPASPDLGAPSPDIASSVTALDAGGLDLGTLYTSSASYA